MEKLAWKIRISTLWLFYAVKMSAETILSLAQPGTIEEIMSGMIGGMQISDGLLLFSSLFWLIPLTMAFLTLILKDSANRWTNLVLGILFLFVGIIGIVEGLTSGQPVLAYLLFFLAGIGVPALIAWHAWKWPRTEG